MNNEIKKGNLNYDQSGRAYPDNPQIKENWDCIWEKDGKHYKLVGDNEHKEWEEIENQYRVMNKEEHYKKIIEKVKVFVGKIDGDDISEIYYLIDDITFEDITNKHFELVDDLYKIANAMWCEYGLDYGKTQNWDDTILKILEIFKDGYVKCDDDLTKLINTIEDGIKN
jgi:hypothetical protein